MVVIIVPLSAHFLIHVFNFAIMRLNKLILVGFKLPVIMLF